VVRGKVWGKTLVLLCGSDSTYITYLIFYFITAVVLHILKPEPYIVAIFDRWIVCYLHYRR